jgi:hypothetical protein
VTWSCGCPYDAPPWHGVVQCRAGRAAVDTTPESTKLPTGCITPAVTVPVEQLDDAGRAHLPAQSLVLLAAARRKRPTSRLTWACGWGRRLTVVGHDEDGKPEKRFVGCPVESLVLRVPGVLWVGWERPQHEDASGPAPWKPVKGQLIDASAPGGVRLVTQTEAGRILK